MDHFQRILACTDFSPVGNHAVARAFAMAHPQVEVRLVHCIDPPETANPLYAHYAPQATWGPEHKARIQAAALAELDKLVPDSARAKALVVSSEAPIGEPVDELLALIERWQAEVIVLGRHQRTGLERLLIGSTAEKLVRSAPCPVLLVPDPQP